MIKALIFLILTFVIFVFYSFSKKLNKITVMLSFLFLLIIFVITLSAFLFIENDKDDKNYVPPYYDGNKVVPGYFNEKN